MLPSYTAVLFMIGWPSSRSRNLNNPTTAVEKGSPGARVLLGRRSPQPRSLCLVLPLVAGRRRLTRLRTIASDETSDMRDPSREAASSITNVTARRASPTAALALATISVTLSFAAWGSLAA